jgi:uncharacterized protein YjiS (DUF1127 family)
MTHVDHGHTVLACTCRDASATLSAGSRHLPSIIRLINRWVQRSSQRHVLRDLDARLLNDIGVSREAAAHEASRPFWS